MAIYNDSTYLFMYLLECAYQSESITYPEYNSQYTVPTQFVW